LSILDQIVNTKSVRGRAAMLYGPPGIGKSTWGACSEDPIFIQTEDGLIDIEVPHFPLCENFSQFMEYVYGLINDEHKFKTAVVDSVDWLEKLIHAHTCQKHGKEALEDFGFARGEKLSLQWWDEVLKALDQLKLKGMNVILLAHSEIRHLQPPDTDPYDKYFPRLNAKYSLPAVFDWCDEVLFANYKVMTKKQEESFGKETRRAIGTGERVVYTTEKPTHQAKNRKGLPDELPLIYDEYIKHFN